MFPPHPREINIKNRPLLCTPVPLEEVESSAAAPNGFRFIFFACLLHRCCVLISDSSPPFYVLSPPPSAVTFFSCPTPPHARSSSGSNDVISSILFFNSLIVWKKRSKPGCGGEEEGKIASTKRSEEENMGRSSSRLEWHSWIRQCTWWLNDWGDGDIRKKRSTSYEKVHKAFMVLHKKKKLT